MTVPLPHRLREIVERVSRDRVLRRRMPADLGGGPIYASPDAMLKYWRRDISASDPALLAAAKQLIRPGMRVWDIGANVGIFTFAAQFLAGPSGHVLGVEADPWLVSLLQRSRASRAGTGAVVDFLCAAVSGNAELARFNIAARGRAASALKGAGTTQMGGVREELIVPTVTLDALVAQLRPPDIAKIDIEGAEGAAFANASSFLDKRPILIIEVSAANSDSISYLLQSHGYRLYDIARVQEGAEIPRAAPNTVALPPPEPPSVREFVQH